MLEGPIAVLQRAAFQMTMDVYHHPHRTADQR